jgi:hypothetical protein
LQALEIVYQQPVQCGVYMHVCVVVRQYCTSQYKVVVRQQCAHVINIGHNLLVQGGRTGMHESYYLVLAVHLILVLILSAAMLSVLRL